MLPLLSDDVDENRSTIKNPNRLLKALTFTNSRLVAAFFHTLNFSIGVVIIGMWWTLRRYWARGLDDNEEVIEGDGGFLDRLVDSLITEQTDGDILGMQLLVSTLMFALHFFFEYLRYRETGAVLPPSKSGDVWDPRRHGLPFKYRLLGMPSMWFTSRKTLEDLKHFMSVAHNVSVSRIFPEEIALFALSGDDERGELRSALSESKMFCAKSRSFTLNDLEKPEALNIDLCFFDTQLHNKDLPYPGEFHYFLDEEDDDGVERQYSSSATPTRMTSRMSSRRQSGDAFFQRVFKSFRSFSNLSAAIGNARGRNPSQEFGDGGGQEPRA